MNQQNLPKYEEYAILPSSTLAIVSVVAGVLAFVMLPVIGSIVALWTGYAARKETRATPPTASGDGMATAGIILGWVHIGLVVIGFCLAILYFGFFAAVIGSALNQ